MSNPRHVIRAREHTFRMKKRRWGPTKIGIRTHVGGSEASQISSRASSREGRAGEKQEAYLSTVPKARRVISKLSAASVTPFPDQKTSSSYRGGVQYWPNFPEENEEEHTPAHHTNRQNGRYSQLTEEFDSSIQSSARQDEPQGHTKSCTDHEDDQPTAEATHEGSITDETALLRYSANASGNSTTSQVSTPSDPSVSHPVKPEIKSPQRHSIAYVGEAEQKDQHFDPLSKPFVRPKITAVQLVSDIESRRVVQSIHLSQDDALDVS